MTTTTPSPIPTDPSPTPSTFRTVWHTKIHPGGQPSTMHVGTHARVVLIDTGAGGDVTAWVEHRPLEAEADPADGTELTFIAVATGEPIGEDFEHVGSVIDHRTGLVRHAYLQVR